MSESEDEYPTDEELARLEAWPYDDIRGGLDYAVSLWKYPDYIDREDGVLYLATGGWSGNESVISAMRHNIGIWSRWICSTRGGAHEFELEAKSPMRISRFGLARKLLQTERQIGELKRELDQPKVPSKDHTEQGRHLALKIWLNCKCGSEYDQELAGTIITQALSRNRNQS